MKLLVLSGGFGTRLQTCIGDLPKALAPVCGFPFLKFQLENWILQGIDNFIFLLHYQANQIISFLESEKSNILKNCSVKWLIESHPMGTGGAIANAIKKIKLKDSFLVTNADTWIGSGISKLIQSVSPAIGVIQITNTSRYGRVKFNENLLITEFEEKRESQYSENNSGWINSGLFHLHPLIFSNWNKKTFSLEKELFVKLTEKCQLNAVPLFTDFIDIGIPGDYYSFCEWIEKNRCFQLVSHEIKQIFN